MRIGFRKINTKPFNHAPAGPLTTNGFFYRSPTIINAISIILVFGLAWALEGCLGGTPSKHTYDGATATILLVDNLTDPETYTIDLKLRSTANTMGNTEYGDTTPPMPFRAGSTIAVYQTRNGYHISIRDASQEKIIQKIIGDPAEYTRITIAASADGVILYVNGGETARSSTPAPLTGNIRIGAGYKQRFWRGQYKYFDVYNSLKKLGEFAPNTGRFNSNSRIMALNSD